MSQVLMVSSGKGGAGKTTFTANLGAALALKGNTVLLLDFNMGIRNLDIYLGLQNSVLFDMGDVLTGMCTMDKALLQCENCENLYMLPCPQGKGISGAGQRHYASLVDWGRENFDYVIMDCPPLPGKLFDYWAMCTDIAVLIVTGDYLALRNTDCLAGRLKKQGVTKMCYAINLIDEDYFTQSELPSLADISRTMSMPLLGVLTRDDNINLGNNKGYPVAFAESSYIGKNFEKMAEKLGCL